MAKTFIKYRVHNIKWDTDGDEALAAELPKELIVNVEEGMDEAADEAVNAASDMQGFCIITADVEEVKD